MSQNERSGVRDLLYSAWHRSRSIGRFLGRRIASLLKAIDIDWCEACHWCDEPVALIETQRSGRTPKSARITKALARRADLPAYSVSYEASFDGDDIFDGEDVGLFRVRQIWPPSDEVVDLKPKAYAQWVWALRRPHEILNPSCAASTARIENDDD